MNRAIKAVESCILVGLAEWEYCSCLKREQKAVDVERVQRVCVCCCRYVFVCLCSRGAGGERDCGSAFACACVWPCFALRLYRSMGVCGTCLI